MKTLLMSLAAAVLVMPLTIGCSRTVSHEDRVSTNPITGTETHHENTVRQNVDGSYTSEQSTEKVAH